MHAASRRKGSSLIIVLILTFALSAVVAGLLNSLVFDKRFNHRISLAGQARNAAEGVVEIAVAEIDRRAASYSSMPTAVLNGFSFPDEMRTFLSDAKVDGASLAFKVGNLSPLPNDPVVIDGNDPFNLPDVDKAKPVILRHAYVYGKATAADPVTGQNVTSYISNLVQVREQTWLNYAVFYNLDLEMHSGSTMDIDGPVHTNQNAYLMGGNSQSLRFYASFTTPKKIFRKSKYNGTVTHTGSVLFAPKEDPAVGELVAMSTSQDSTKSGFKTFASNTWNGFVQDVSFGVPVFNPPGLLQYVPDNPSTGSVNEMRNTAYAMIEPQLADVSSDTLSTHTYSGYKGDVVENQKFSALSGLTIRVKPVADWPTAPLSAAAVISGTDPAGTDPGFELVYYTGANPSLPVNRANLPQRNTTTRKPIETVIDLQAMKTRMHPALLAKLLAAIRPIRYVEDTSSGTAGNRSLLAPDTNPTVNGIQAWDSDGNSANGTQSWYGIYDRRQGYQHASASNTNNNNGRKGAHHALHIDLDKLDDFLNADPAEFVDQLDGSKKVYWPDANYSGVMYVQFPLVPDSDTSVSARKNTDKIRPAVAPTTSTPGYAVILRNAKRLPRLAPDLTRRDDGFTFATNGPVYIMGNYNADGLSNTGSMTAPDDPAANDPDHVFDDDDELPALIAADAVTLLSSAYTDSDMRESAKTPLNNAAFTEVATGIIAGIVPTRLNTSGVGSNNQLAGGVHNFVRFLENWDSDVYRYRGSIVCLYENEVSEGPWHQSSSSSGKTYGYPYWYDFPERDVGYHVYFAGGRFPPGLPVMRTVRRISVADITKAEYDAGPPTPPAAAN